jgi:sigma-B regulation protein RsbU (phosphoserine phosphatase)
MGPPPVLRVFKDIAWEQNTVQLSPGDVLVLYSDDITEAEDTQEDFFDEERLREVVQADLGGSADGIQDAIIQNVRDIVGTAPQSDDMTLMVLVRAQGHC